MANAAASDAETLVHALSMCEQFGRGRAAAARQMEQIDRPFLREQRAEHSGE